MRTLIGGLGYRHLRDHSFGVLVSDALAAQGWPAHVSVEDVSYNPIALVHRLQDDPPDRRFTRAVIVGAAWRGSRPPGTLDVYRWDNALPGSDRIQAAVAAAVTGIIDLDNTLIVTRHFGALPREVIVIEVEPATHEPGEALSPPVARIFDRACALAVRCAMERVPLPARPLGLVAAAPPGPHGSRTGSLHRHV